MPVIDSSIILRLFDQGEIECSVEHPFIPDRQSLNIISGTNTYTLPDYILSIRRLTYLGIGLDPLPRRNQREVFQNSTQQGTPFWYVFDNIGLNNILLFPCPNANIATVTGNLWTQAKILTGCIIEFNRVTDNAGGSFSIPASLRRQLLKKYVQANIAQIDGASVDIKSAKYFLQRWAVSKQEFFDLIDELYSQPRRLVINDFNTFNFFPGSPVLPINRFGISVNEGE